MLLFRSQFGLESIVRFEYIIYKQFADNDNMLESVWVLQSFVVEDKERTQVLIWRCSNVLCEQMLDIISKVATTLVMQSHISGIMQLLKEDLQYVKVHSVMSASNSCKIPLLSKAL